MNVFPIHGRLLRRLFYRTWKTFVVQQTYKLISSIEYEVNGKTTVSMPTIILSTYTKPDDFMVLMHVFKDHDLTLIAPEELPNDKIISKLKILNRLIRVKNNKFDFYFLREFLATLQRFNRSIVVTPDAGYKFITNFAFDHINLVRIAMMANVPIQPVILNWDVSKSLTTNTHKKCKVFVGKRVFISPRNLEFKDVFFRRKGKRKYSKLLKEECNEIGIRIFSKFNQLKDKYGSNLS